MNPDLQGLISHHISWTISHPGPGPLTSHGSISSHCLSCLLKGKAGAGSVGRERVGKVGRVRERWGASWSEQACNQPLTSTSHGHSSSSTFSTTDHYTSSSTCSSSPSSTTEDSGLVLSLTTTEHVVRVRGGPHGPLRGMRLIGTGGGSLHAIGIA